MKDREIDVLAINETRMDDSVPIQSIAILGYSWISKNRNRSGGGIGFFVRESTNFLLRTDMPAHLLQYSIKKYSFKFNLIHI